VESRNLQGIGGVKIWHFAYIIYGRPLRNYNFIIVYKFLDLFPSFIVLNIEIVEICCVSHSHNSFWILPCFHICILTGFNISSTFHSNVEKELMLDSVRLRHSQQFCLNSSQWLLLILGGFYIGRRNFKLNMYRNICPAVLWTDGQD